MKVHPRCRACLSGQSTRIFDVLQIDGKTRSSNLKAMQKFIDERFTEDRITAELGTEVHRELKRITNNSDPFKEEKERSNRVALKLVDHARALIENASEPLYQSFKIAIAGNLMDFSIYKFDVDLNEKELEAALSDEFVIDDFDSIKRRIEGAGRILYLCDNAGEIVFDRLCIEEIQKLGPEVTAVVKSGPIVNDATMQDARAAGLDAVCNVIESGTDCVGVISSESSAEFLKELKSADLIMAKGQGHFETMEDMELPIAFLLKAKCQPVAEALGVKQKSSVVMLGHSPH